MAILARWQATIVDDEGNIQPNASVEVRREVGGSPLALIFSDREGNTPIGNPMAADSEGFVAFHVVGGAYRITATKNGFSRVWRYVGIGNASEQDGIASGVRLRFNDDTADSDPGSGYLKFNNADLASVTEIYVSDFSFLDFDISSFIDTFDDGGAVSNRGLLTIQSANEDGFFVAQITDSVVPDGSPSAYRKLSVTPLAFSQGTFIAEDLVGIAFNQAGGGVAAPVGFADIQEIETSRLLGRDTAGDGVIEQLTLTRALDLIGSAAEGDILYRDDSAWQRLPRGSEGQVLQLVAAGSPPGPVLPAWAARQGGVVAIIEDQKSQGTAAQSLTAGADRTRELTTIAYNRDEIASLGSNQFTLPAGDWEISWHTSVYSTSNDGDHQSLLYNATDVSEVARGTSGHYDQATVQAVGSCTTMGCAVVSIDSAKAFEIRHRVTGDCFGGRAANLGTEVYTRVIVRRA